jgi:hypothetical protein
MSPAFSVLVKQAIAKTTRMMERIFFIAERQS